jgi:phosphoribosylformylglycinamidine synthase
LTGGKIAIAEAARNLACVGARPIGATDCLNFSNPEKPENFWAMRKVCEGLSEACRAFEVPIISGNVSMYNESAQGPIYLTPTIGMVGLIEPNTPRMTMEFKQVGDIVVLLGETRNALGGTEYLKVQHGLEVGLPPTIDLAKEKDLHETLIASIEAGVISAAHDLSEGGLLIGLAEMAVAGGLGARVDLQRQGLRTDALLFAESQSRALVTVAKDKVAQLEKIAAKYAVPYTLLGEVIETGFVVAIDGSEVLNTSVAQVTEIYEQAIPRLLKA